MISRTFSASEQNYATDERKLLAIVWALKKLRHYLYGIKDIHIFTDHQPMTFAMPEKNHSPKMKRWRAFIEELSPTFNFTFGKDNVVADALSRQFSHHLIEVISGGSVHSEQSLSKVIKTVNCPINKFRNQLIMSKSNSFSKNTKIIFNKLIRLSLSLSRIFFSA